MKKQVQNLLKGARGSATSNDCSNAPRPIGAVALIRNAGVRFALLAVTLGFVYGAHVAGGDDVRDAIGWTTQLICKGGTSTLYPYDVAGNILAVSAVKTATCGGAAFYVDTEGASSIASVTRLSLWSPAVS